MERPLGIAPPAFAHEAHELIDFCLISGIQAVNPALKLADRIVGHGMLLCPSMSPKARDCRSRILAACCENQGKSFRALRDLPAVPLRKGGEVEDHRPVGPGLRGEPSS